jgi:hypothetical protein
MCWKRIKKTANSVIQGSVYTVGCRTVPLQCFHNADIDTISNFLFSITSNELAWSYIFA